jgi:hypothetical protein
MSAVLSLGVVPDALNVIVILICEAQNKALSTKGTNI